MDYQNSSKKLETALGILSGLIAFIFYMTTVAPTVSFWDCGEFVACSYSLGIPHPPGTPLFVIIGRVFTIILPFIKEVAFRINLISVLTSTASIFFIYFSILRIVKFWFKVEKEDSPFLHFAPAVGSFTGALLVAFSATWWFNTVEAEVYGLAMLILAITFYLTLKWYDHRKTEKGNKILILITYLAFLGIGAHLYTMIIMPFTFLFIALYDEDKRKDWRLYLVGFTLLSVIYSISSFLFLGPIMMVLSLVWIVFKRDLAKYINLLIFGSIGIYLLKNAMPSGTEGFDGLGFLVSLSLIALVILPFIKNTPEKEGKKKWNFIFWMSLVAMLGYSVHFYIPIRSFQDPMIDENNPEVIINSFDDFKNPETWKQFRYFLERKQYGSESMVVRMFNRRGEFFSQFINHQHMGFGGYFATQFFSFGDQHLGKVNLGNGPFAMVKLFLYLLPIVFAGWGLWYHTRKDWRSGLLLGSLYIACTIGLVMYMNFADGTTADHSEMTRWMQNGQNGPQPKPIHMEVRERDYFFTPGFMFHAFLIGLAFIALLQVMTRKYRKHKNLIAKFGLLIIMLVPIIPIYSNTVIEPHTRAGNWVAYDYAYNLLQSCDKNGILFTNGDNDTFPLWFAQEVLGLRRDIRIVNLSLVNTDWYVNQIYTHKPFIGLEFSVYDEQMNKRQVAKEGFSKTINHQRNSLLEPKRMLLNKEEGLWTLVDDFRKKSYFRIQDYMVLNIASNNIGTRPIYFAVTVSDGNLMGLKPYLTMEGLVYRLDENKVKQLAPVYNNLQNAENKLKDGFNNIGRIADVITGTYSIKIDNSNAIKGTPKSVTAKAFALDIAGITANNPEKSAKQKEILEKFHSVIDNFTTSYNRKSGLYVTKTGIIGKIQKDGNIYKSSFVEESKIVTQTVKKSVSLYNLFLKDLKRLAPNALIKPSINLGNNINISSFSVDLSKNNSLKSVGKLIELIKNKSITNSISSSYSGNFETISGLKGLVSFTNNILTINPQGKAETIVSDVWNNASKSLDIFADAVKKIPLSLKLATYPSANQSKIFLTDRMDSRLFKNFVNSDAKILKTILDANEKQREGIIKNHLQGLRIIAADQIEILSKSMAFAFSNPSTQSEVKALLDEFNSVRSTYNSAIKNVNNNSMNYERTGYLLDEVYRFTNLGLRDKFIRDETQRLLGNYGATFIGYVLGPRGTSGLIAQYTDLERKIELEKSNASSNNLANLEKEKVKLFAKIKRLLNRYSSILPTDWRPKVVGAKSLASIGHYTDALTLIEQGKLANPTEPLFDYYHKFITGDSLYFSAKSSKSTDAKNSAEILKLAAKNYEEIIYKLDTNLAAPAQRETRMILQRLIEIYRETKNKEQEEKLMSVFNRQMSTTRGRR